MSGHLRGVLHPGSKTEVPSNSQESETLIVFRFIGVSLLGKRLGTSTFYHPKSGDATKFANSVVADVVPSRALVADLAKCDKSRLPSVLTNFLR